MSVEFSRACSMFRESVRMAGRSIFLEMEYYKVKGIARASAEKIEAEDKMRPLNSRLLGPHSFPDRLLSRLCKRRYVFSGEVWDLA